MSSLKQNFFFNTAVLMLGVSGLSSQAASALQPYSSSLTAQLPLNAPTDLSPNDVGGENNPNEPNVLPPSAPILLGPNQSEDLSPNDDEVDLYDGGVDGVNGRNGVDTNNPRGVNGTGDIETDELNLINQGNSIGGEGSATGGRLNDETGLPEATDLNF